MAGSFERYPMDKSVLLDMFAHMSAVLCATSVAAMALKRWRASKSNNKFIYAAVGLATVALSIIGFADVISGHQSHPLVVILSLMSPLAWITIVWVAWTPSARSYYDDRGPVEETGRHRKLRAKPGHARKIPAVNTRYNNQSSAPALKYRRRQTITPPHWPMPLTLEFLPGTDRSR